MEHSKELEDELTKRLAIFIHAHTRPGTNEELLARAFVRHQLVPIMIRTSIEYAKGKDCDDEIQIDPYGDQ